MTLESDSYYYKKRKAKKNQIHTIDFLSKNKKDSCYDYPSSPTSFVKLVLGGPPEPHCGYDYVLIY
jgi:hypothetical protein